MKKLVLGLALALLLSATLSGGAMAEKYVIDSGVWSHFQGYLKAIGKTRPGGFAITKDGHGAYYVWCQETRCVAGPGYGQEARNACESSYDTDCVVFAIRDEIRVEYEVAAAAPTVTQQAAVTPPVSGVAIIRISSTLREDVERYLKNSASFGTYYRFLAINQAGDKIGSSNCRKMTTWISDGCAGMSNPHEGAKRVALQACGRPNECRLIFEGANKIGVFEIEWY